MSSTATYGSSAERFLSLPFGAPCPRAARHPSSARELCSAPGLTHKLQQAPRAGAGPGCQRPLAPDPLAERPSAPLPGDTEPHEMLQAGDGCWGSGLGLKEPGAARGDLPPPPCSAGLPRIAQGGRNPALMPLSCNAPQLGHAALAAPGKLIYNVCF